RARNVTGVQTCALPIFAKLSGHRQAHSPARMGGRMPLHCTAVGKILLAHADDAVIQEFLSLRLERRMPRTITNVGVLSRQLESARETGAAFEYEESAHGLACVAAPVLDTSGKLRAALSIAGATG